MSTIEIPDELKPIYQRIRQAIADTLASNHYILDGRDPVPVTLLEFAEWYEHKPQERILAQDKIRPWVMVSTVFLGLDHSFGRSKKPVLFETLIFGGKYSGKMFRYDDFDIAIDQHQIIVRDLLKIERVPRRWRARIEKRMEDREVNRIAAELDALCPREIEIPDQPSEVTSCK